MGYIYKHTSPSGKAYIGQSWEEPEVRWRGHVWAALNRHRGCRVFNAAIRKYGPDAFTTEILHDGIDSQSEMDRLEELAIAEHGTRVPNGYNVRSGGSRGRHHASTKALLSERITALYQDPTSVYHSKDFKRKQAAAQRKFWDCDTQRQEASKRSTAYWSDEQARKEQSKRQQLAWTEERRKAHSEKMLEYNSRPDAHRNNPTYQEQMSRIVTEWHRKTAHSRIFGDGEFFVNQREAGIVSHGVV